MLVSVLVHLLLVNPILDQKSQISIPYARLNCSKTTPFTAAHTGCTGYIWEYSLGGGGQNYGLSGESEMNAIPEKNTALQF